MMEEIVVTPEQIVSKTMLERGEITIERAVKFKIGEITLTELLEQSANKEKAGGHNSPGS